MQTEPRADISRDSKYFLYIAIAFVAVLMISDTVGSKLIQIGQLTLSATIFIFPISYIFGDILTEVYGYKASRKVIWSGFAAVIFMVFCYWFVKILPSASFWPNQGAYEVILGATPRLVLGSILAYFCGELSNSYVLSKMKIWSSGKHLWTRTIGSTIVGEGIDTLIFITVVFAGTIPASVLASLIVSQYLVKVAYETVATPLTYIVVNALKRAEGIDVYDKGISYNPFTLAE
jgi:queuosine precursor transporter